MESLERKTMFSLGIFVLLGILGFSSIIWFFSKRSISGNQEFRVAFTDIGGVSKGAEVLFAGKHIGSVVGIRSIVDSGLSDSLGHLYAYELILRLDDSVKVYKEDAFTITSPRIIGERVIHIIPKTKERIPENLLLPQSLSFGVNKDPVKQIGDFTKLVQDLVDIASEEIVNVSHSIISVSEIIKKSLVNNDNEFLTSKLVATANSVKKSADRMADCLENVHSNSVKDVLENIEEISSDIRSYGIFYRYNRDWKRFDKQRKLKRQEVVSKE
ncbi:MlaD family protein [Chlamydiifrater volucris]|uniref:MlaD family protein n=1 Tax=Chlamydiifrater volucris TaxID=2681470 RepID=UPI001BCE5B21|nr:MlaD family protein [Chlamydiifrater volucris]